MVVCDLPCPLDSLSSFGLRRLRKSTSSKVDPDVVKVSSRNDKERLFLNLTGLHRDE